MSTGALKIPLDRSSPVPLYFQVAQQLEQAIEAGELPPGARLDNEIDFAERLGLSRPTMRRAIQYLVEQGLLVRKRGVGTQVVHTKVRRSIELTSLHDDLVAAGQRPRTDVLSHRVVPADQQVARALGVAEDTSVLALERLRFARDEPLALMHNYLPSDVVRLDPADLEEQGLYALLRAGGINLRVAAQTIGARAATPAEARLLAERRGTPLLTMTRTTYDDSGRIVEYATHLYRASMYAFELTLLGR
ncbi:MAG: GntR family transcriptional regulator [Mycobacteriales bacterium]|nr:MAG: GntR family transcriptional regulator [Pseudonocardiales bacterium]